MKPLIEVCRTCPIANECRIWAAEDAYTGVAGGEIWTEGQQRPPVSIDSVQILDEAS